MKTIRITCQNPELNRDAIKSDGTVDLTDKDVKLRGIKMVDTVTDLIAYRVLEVAYHCKCDIDEVRSDFGRREIDILSACGVEFEQTDLSVLEPVTAAGLQELTAQAFIAGE